jgi:hypothetical protein
MKVYIESPGLILLIIISVELHSLDMFVTDMPHLFMKTGISTSD